MVEDHKETQVSVEQSMDDYIDKSTTKSQESNLGEDTNKSSELIEKIASDDEDSVDRTEYENCLEEGNPSQQGSLEFLNEKISDGKHIKTRSKSLELFYIENFANVENPDGSIGKGDVENLISDNETSKQLKSQSFETEDDARNNDNSSNYSDNDTEHNDSENSGSSNHDNIEENSDNKSNEDNNSSSNINHNVDNNHNNNKNSNKGLWEITKALNAYDWYMSQSSLDELSCIEEEGTVDEDSSEQSENEGEESKFDILKPEYQGEGNETNEKRFSENEMSNEQERRNGSFVKKNSSGKGLDELKAKNPSVQAKRNHQRLSEEEYSDEKPHNELNESRVSLKEPEMEELQNGVQNEESREDQRNVLGVNGVEEEDSDVDESGWETDEENEGSENEQRAQLAGGGNGGRRVKVYFNDSREYNGDEDDSDVEEIEERKEPRKGERGDKGNARVSFNGSKRYHDDVNDDDDDDSYEETSEYSSEEEMSDSSVEQKKVAIKELNNV